ncbi:unnamed protein product [Heligmosomoides polygyrus]|uniref:HTH OST-type domain-containing protein n=1 Tax=Heligmosomoides polygyrus TaxID=6339 RepID=A0A183FTQ2_HELPZ|nr:unnamed protein product [Heligmosomoides polygyrus]
MGDDQLRRCVLEELRKAQGEPLSPDELFDRCGGPKATSLNVDTFMTFIAQHCSRAVKAIHDAGDENSLPRYALHVDSARKTGTLKRRTPRSHSQSSSRGATPEAAIARFNPRTDGFSIFCLVVRKLSANSLDGTVNWNVIRNQYRKETGRHLNAEELNAMCGTLNMTKHDLLSTHLSSVVQILDSRGQIVRPASPFNPKTPSPTSISSRSSGEELSPRTDARLDANHLDAAEESARRRLIVEQLRRNGVVVDDHGRAVVHEGRSPLSSQSSENSSQEADAFREFATPMSTLKDVDESVDSAEFMTPLATLAGEAMIASEIREREHSGDFADLRHTPESGQTSFVSVDPVLDTSGEGGYTTGFDATPESDVSLDFSVDRSAHESTPRRHEITLCNVDDSVQEAEEEVTRHESEKKVIPENEKMAKDESQKRDALVELAKSYQEGESDSEGSAEISIIKRATELDEHQAEQPLVANKSEKVPLSDEDDEHLAADASPSTLCSAASYHIAEIEDERDDVFDEHEDTIEADFCFRQDGEQLHVPKIVIEDVSSLKQQEQSAEEEDDMKEMTEEQVHPSQEPDTDRTVEVVPTVRERALSFEEGIAIKNASGEGKHHPQEELDECFTAVEFVPTVRERVKSFEEGHVENDHDRSVREDSPLESTVPVKEQVEKFEHLHDGDDLDESRRSHFDEEEIVENVDVQEIVHELELSATEQHDTAGLKQHEVEHFPASVHVNETVHRLEHELGRSLPVCEQYEEFVHREERRLDAGDAPALDQYSEKVG